MPTAYSPRTGYVYIPANNLCMDFEGMEANYIAGTPYTGASVRIYPGKAVAIPPVRLAKRPTGRQRITRAGIRKPRLVKARSGSEG